MDENKALQRQVTATILQLRLRSPFFATLALFARIHITQIVTTAATDGRDIFINADFWAKLTQPQRLGLLAHEVLHAALLHVLRRGTREPLLWNIAADVVVNGLILAEPGFELPEGHVRDKDLEHLSVEEIYHLLQNHVQEYELVMVDLLYDNEGQADSVTALDAVARKMLEEHWRQALQQAKTLAQTLGHGKLPAGLERELANLSPSQLDWRSYLWRFLVQTPTDFQGYDRRFVGQGLYLENLQGESVRVYIAVDTSGSISREDIGQFLGEVVGILDAYPHLVGTLYYVDAECYGPYPLSDKTDIPQPVGGGGTDFRPFFEAVEESRNNDPSSGVCVYLTDGYGTFPDEAPSLHTLWILSPGGIDVDSVPFGEAVRLLL